MSESNNTGQNVIEFVIVLALLAVIIGTLLPMGLIGSIVGLFVKE